MYDLHHHLGPSSLGDRDDGEANRFLDSGGYEVHPAVDVLDLQGASDCEPWSPDLYVATARAHARRGDTLISLDDPALPPEEQIRQSLLLFDAVGISGVRRDLLIHPSGMTPHQLAHVIADRSAEFDILGLTEKDIGEPWFLAAAFLRELRDQLDARLDRYLPIHVFGCLDPRTLPYLFFAGADIFDGLAWMRYYFRDGHAYYAKEMEHDLSPEILLDRRKLTSALLGHNIEQLERLRNDLQYSVLADDYEAFVPCLDILFALEPLAPTTGDDATTTAEESQERD